MIDIRPNTYKKRISISDNYVLPTNSIYAVKPNIEIPEKVIHIKPYIYSTAQDYKKYLNEPIINSDKKKLPIIVNGRVIYKNGGSKSSRRSLEDGYVTTGGAGYIPSVDITDVAKKLYNLFNYSTGYLKQKLFGTGEGTFIDLSNKNVSRINKDTKNVESILTNDFLEKRSNTVRKKKDFVNTTDTLLGDKNIPLHDISTFYGIENGKLKAGDLSIFNDTTTVAPNRTKNVGKLKQILVHQREGDKWYIKYLTDKDEDVINKYNKSKGYFVNGWFDKKPSTILKHREGSDAIDRVLRNYKRGVTEQGDTVMLPEINASPKILFANEKGDASFVSNLSNPKNLEQLNAFLSNHPSYPIMVDNGRYSSYIDKNPVVEEYSGLANPNDMFIIGTTRAKRKEGGIHIAPSKRGTFTTAATKHGMGVQEFASRVLRNKDSYSPAMVKKANFARNASKWNH